MKLELGKFEIKDIQFADKSYVENHVLYVNKEEVEALVLEERQADRHAFGKLQNLVKQQESHLLRMSLNHV